MSPEAPCAPRGASLPRNPYTYTYSYTYAYSYAYALTNPASRFLAATFRVACAYAYAYVYEYVYGGKACWGSAC